MSCVVHDHAAEARRGAGATGVRETLARSGRVTLREGRSSWPTGRCSRASRSAPRRRAASPPARSCSTPCSPATRRSSPTRRYAGQIITFTYPHIGNYGVTAADDESRRPFCRGVVVRELARRRSSWRSDGDLDDLLRRHGIAGIAGIDTRRLTRHIRDDRRACRAPSATRGRGGAAGRRGGRAGHRRDRPRGRGDHRPALHGRRRCSASGSSPTTSASSARSCATSAALATVEVVPASTAGRRRARPRARRRVPVQRPRRPGRGPLRRRRHRRAARAGAGVRHLPRPPAAGPGHRRRDREAARSATTAATTRCSTWPPAGWRSPARTTTSPSPRTPSAAGPRSPTSTSTTACARACACATSPAFSVQYHPEAGPGPHDSRLPVRGVRLDDGPLAGERDLVMTAPTGHEPPGSPEPDAGAA